MALKHILESEKFNPKRNVHIPCEACSGVCCKPIGFTTTEIRSIERKYDLSEYLKKGGKVFSEDLYKDGKNNLISFYRFDHKGDKVCAFKKDDSVNRCMIYEDRPGICKCYGSTELLRCQYENMSAEPTSQAEANMLSIANDALREKLFAGAYKKAEDNNDLKDLVRLMDK